MSFDDNKIIDIMRKNIYTCEKDSYGHLYVIINNFTPAKYTKKQKQMVIEYIIQITRESLVISNNNNNKTSYVHLDITNCSRENFNLAWFKKINTVFSETFEDTLKAMFIYSNSKIFSSFWKIIKNFIDKDTKDKIMLINC
tara:strand:- start:262 stop:684 length:423 start_codon:yes stop_codon:yes gene_type:complete